MIRDSELQRALEQLHDNHHFGIVRTRLAAMRDNAMLIATTNPTSTDWHRGYAAALHAVAQTIFAPDPAFGNREPTQKPSSTEAGEETSLIY